MSHNEMKTSDAFPKSLEAFAKRYQETHPECMNAFGHNLYLVQTIDKDGNVTDEKYGINLMTNYGFRQCYREWNDSASYAYFWIGSNDNDGGSDPSFTDTALNHKLTDKYTTTQALSIDYTKQLGVYHPESRTVTQVCASASGTYEYTLDGEQTADWTIREIGTSLRHSNENRPSTLYTRTLIYDDQGNPSSIIKHLNEQLTIKVYFSWSYSVDMIEALYQQGIYVVMEPKAMDFSNPTRYTGSNAVRRVRESNFSSRSYSRMNAPDNPGSVATPSEFINSNHAWYKTTSTTMLTDNVYLWTDEARPDILMTQKYATLTGHMIQDVNKYSFIAYDEHDKLTTPETITSEAVYCNHWNDLSLSCAFILPSPVESPEFSTHNAFFRALMILAPSEFQGKYPFNEDSSNSAPVFQYTPFGSLPCTDFDMTSSYMYDYTTHDWTIQDQFVNAPNAYYNYASTLGYTRLWIKDPNGISKDVHVFVNTRTDIPITKIGIDFALSGVQLFATDEYWDVSTWEEIVNRKSVPLALQTKKYYIDASAQCYCIIPYREQTTHAIVPTKQPYKILDESYSATTKDSPYWDEYMYPFDYTRNVSHQYKMLRSNVNNWIMGDRYIVYPEILDENDKPTRIDLFPLSDLPVGSTQPSGRNFIPSAIVRYATDDFIVIMNTRTGYGDTSGNNSRHNHFRVYRVTDDPSEFTNTPIEITFTYSATANDNWEGFHHTWSKLGYLVQTPVFRATYKKIGILKLYGGSDPSNPTPEVTMIDNGYDGRALDGTTMMVYNDATDRTIFHVYDMETNTEDHTFTVPEGYTYQPDTLVGFGSHVYMRVSKDSVYNVYYYNIETKDGQLMLDWDGTQLVPESYNTASQQNHVTDTWTWRPIIASEYGLIFTGYYGNDNNNWKTAVITADDPMTVKTFDELCTHELASIAKFNDKSMYQRYICIMSQIVKTYDQKHLLWLCYTSAAGYNSSRIHTNCVLDFGMMADGVKQINPPFSQGNVGHRNTSYRTHGGICEYHSGIVVATDTEELWWSPIEAWLPHKVTGTTHTIQTFNNPKKIHCDTKYRKIWFANDASITQIPE